MDFKIIQDQYRPLPFWSWNDRLEIEETRNQVRQMHEAGIGGFFMHARNGLQTEYMGEEWFENVGAAVMEAQENQMRAWAYDENGWPSGFGAGCVNNLGIEYQQKYLRMEEDFVHKETAICRCGNHYFYYDVNPYYVDTLNPRVVAEFIRCAYEPYYERYKNQIEGFFTDEPQISRNGIPWSFIFEEEYEKKYHENILEHLDQLFLPIGEYKITRIRFWKMVTDLFSESYMKQIYDWCSARNLKLTGHLLLEETLESQLTTNGACMPHYEYFHIPGVDWLGNGIRKCLSALQVSSVAEQLGKEAVLTESYAMCGHNMSFAEFKGLFEWQLVHGVNLLCQHLEGYSNRGIRKRDYPPAMYIQQPWWKNYRIFNEMLAREGMILGCGKKEVKLLVIHPQTTAWSCFDTFSNEGLQQLNENFLSTISALEKKHVAFHLGDETIMERYAMVVGSELWIGNQHYSKIIVKDCELFLESTQKLLDEFVRAGGQIVTPEEVKPRKIISCDDISYTSCSYDDCRIHFFVNSSDQFKCADIFVTGNEIHTDTGDVSSFSGSHMFEPWGSLMLVEEKVCAVVQKNEESIRRNYIKPEGEFHMIASSWNCLTLDQCDYYFDGVLQEEKGYVLNICERANKLERKVRIRQEYAVKFHSIPKVLYLGCETPERFQIEINGKPVLQNIEGFYLDKSIKKIPISEYVHCGMNRITFECDFEQSEEFYRNLKKAYIFESEKNKLTYDMEIEPVYIIGDFSVKTPGKWSLVNEKNWRYRGEFFIDEPLSKLKLMNIEQQGFPFFCGSITVEGELMIHGENPVLMLDKKGINVVEVKIEDKTKVLLSDSALSLEGCQGKVKVALTLTNNLRNVFGPHHLDRGDFYGTAPSVFYKENCVWNQFKGNRWNDDYCFAEMSLYSNRDYNV